MGWLGCSSWLLLTSLASLTTASLLLCLEQKEDEKVEKEKLSIWLPWGGQEDMEKVEWLNKATSQVGTVLDGFQHFKKGSCH